MVDTGDILEIGGRGGPVDVIVEGTEAFEREGTVAVADAKSDMAESLTIGRKLVQQN